MEENVIQINVGITINVDVSVKIKYRAKQKHLLPFHNTNNELKEVMY